MAENTNKLLLPDRHPQKNFFIADIFDSLPIKDDMASMGHPMFSLSKNKDLRVINYSSESINISISPSLKHGLPTIFDKDILLYCASVLMEQMNKGTIPPKTIRTSSYELMVTTNRITNGNSYIRLEEALNRLSGVLIHTNIKTNNIEQSKAFHLIDSFEFIKSNFIKDRRVALDITVSDWFYNSVIGKEVLTISRDYFRLGKALERRLYEIARKHCGKQKEWRVSLETLYDKSGSTGDMPKFRFFIRAIAKTNHLPEYTIKFFDGDSVLFENRKEENDEIDMDNLPSISANAIEKGRKIVEKAGTGWDYQEIRSQFVVQIMEGFRPEKPDGAFINFVKKKVAKCP